MGKKITTFAPGMSGAAHHSTTPSQHNIKQTKIFKIVSNYNSWFKNDLLFSELKLMAHRGVITLL